MLQDPCSKGLPALTTRNRAVGTDQNRCNTYTTVTPDSKNSLVMGSVMLIRSELSGTIKSRREMYLSIIYLFQERHVIKVSNSNPVHNFCKRLGRGVQVSLCIISRTYITVFVI
jgi:hypothetical protein